MFADEIAQSSTLHPKLQHPNVRAAAGVWHRDAEDLVVKFCLLIDLEGFQVSKLEKCVQVLFVDRLLVGWLNGSLWEGCHESRRCLRDTFPESYITKYTTYTKKASEPRHVQVGPPLMHMSCLMHSKMSYLMHQKMSHLMHQNTSCLTH